MPAALKPALAADWATAGVVGVDLVQPANNPYLTGTGWSPQEEPPRETFNWWQHLVGQWTDYVRDAAFTATVGSNLPGISAVGDGTFSGASFVGGPTNGIGLQSLGIGAGAGANIQGGNASGTGVVMAGGGPNGKGGTAAGAGTGAGFVGVGGGTAGIGGDFSAGGSGGTGVVGRGAVGDSDGVGGLGSGTGAGATLFGGGNGPGLVALPGVTDGLGVDIQMLNTRRGHIRMQPLAATPTNPTDGEVWIENVTGTWHFKVRMNGVTSTVV